MNALLIQARQWLASRSPHERRMLLIALIVVAGALLYTLADWAWQEKLRLSRRLPEAQQQLIRMQEDSNELLQLKRAQPAAAISIDTLAQSAEAAARARGIDISVKILPDAIEVSGSGAFHMITDWLASLQADHTLRPRSMTMTDNTTRVSFSALLIPAVQP